MNTLFNHHNNNDLAMWTSAVVVTSILAGATWLYRDYTAWKEFGTGGTPANISGYMKITKFRVLRAYSRDDLKDASTLSSEGVSYLASDLPRREGAPPRIIARTLPQRQYPAKKPLEQDVYRGLHNLPKKYAEQLGDVLRLDKSITEGRTTDAIYSTDAHRQGARDPKLGDEIAHVHPAENSLHVWLTQPDAKKVLLAGWGERFPLASLGMVDNGWTFVYAPRTMAELAVVEEIVRAGIGHLTGKRC